jgi:cell fate regulator YaaT (PSP1 superfamily)
MWKNVGLYALEAHDLALTKIERNFERDRDDVQRLAKRGFLNRETLRSRYLDELRPYLTRENMA